MPIDITTLAELDSTSLKTLEDFLAAFLKDAFPSARVKPGTVFRDVFARAGAITNAIPQQTYTRLKGSMSMLDIIQNPTLADATSVDKILSNYNITRLPGTQAQGQLTIILSANVFTPISPNTIFTANGKTFHPSQSFSGVPTAANVTTSHDRLITQRSDGNYSFVIDVVADEVGEESRASRDTRFTAEPSIQAGIDIVATGDFVYGTGAETNEQLLARLQNGITAKVLGSRITSKAIIKNQFPAVNDVSIVGTGDAEMLRDGHSLLGIKTGCKADVYVRTSDRPVTATVIKEAKLCDVGNRIWQLDFTRDEFPAMYKVTTILPADATNASGSFEIVSDVRGADTTEVTGVDRVPAITGTESVYTRYQTVTIRFCDSMTDTTDMAIGDTKDYRVDVLYMPSIAEINDWLLNRSRHPEGGDYLVKAPIPCNVAVSLLIRKGVGDPDPNIGALTVAIASAVNSVDFASGQLPSSVIIGAVQALLTGRTQVVPPLDLRGEIRFPSGESAWVFNPNNLIPPDRPELMATSRTVAFYLDPNDVHINVVTSNVRPV